MEGYEKLEDMHINSEANLEGNLYYITILFIETIIKDYYMLLDSLLIIKYKFISSLTGSISMNDRINVSIDSIVAKENSFSDRGFEG